jgi:hypothetical protein
VTAACLGLDLNEPPSRDSSVSADGALGEIMVKSRHANEAITTSALSGSCLSREKCCSR